MTTVLLHNGAVAPKLEKPRPQVKVVRGGNRGLQPAGSRRLRCAF